MKKHLAVLCGIFYPDPSATGQCVKRFVELLSDDYNIDLICMSMDNKTAEVNSGNGIRIHKLSGRRMSLEARSHGIVKKMLHLFGGVQIKTLLLGNLDWYRTAARNMLEKIHANNNLDAVFSICSPFAAHCAAMDFKCAHPTVHWCGYTVDPYAAKNRIRPFWCDLQRLITEERAVLCKMDTVVLSEEVYKNRPELYEGCKNCRELPYMLPEFSIRSSERKFFNEQDINCVYAGSFYRDIRNPECMLQIFSHMDDQRVKLHLFSSGCEDLVKKYTEASSNIIVHPRVSSSEMVQVYQDADILVNIGNATAEFMPSKTFEYIATGKPIVNFYYDEHNREVLGKYPMCFQIPNVLDFSINMGKELQKFVVMNGQNTVSQNDIIKIFSNHSRENISKILHTAL